MTTSMLNAWNADHLQTMQTNYWPHKMPAWLNHWRDEQLQLFLQLDFPSRHQENWKYTNISAIKEQFFHLANIAEQNKIIDITSYIIPDAYRMVFINGIYAPDLSQLDNLPAEITLMPLSMAWEQIDAYQNYMQNNHPGSLFSHLNAALMTDGLLLSVPSNTIVEKPIHLLYLTTSADKIQMYHPRNILIAKENSGVNILEEYATVTNEIYFNNIVTSIFAEKNARVNHYKLQNDSQQAFHLANIGIMQEQGSCVCTYHITTGAKLGRDDLNVKLQGLAAECQLMGFYYLHDQQYRDNHTHIEHLVPQGRSEQDYRGILNGQSRAVFNGKITVQPHAQKTSAKQSNKNILLSKQAEMNTKPELEIYANDVRCTHGATVGQLSDEALFYLQSRGFDHDNARQLLLTAFIDEALNRMPKSLFAEYIKQHIRKII